MFTNEGARVN